MLMLRKMTTFLCTSLSYPVMAYDLPSSSSGSIQFYGAIVESPCQFNWDEERTELTCWNNGEQINQDKNIEYQKNNDYLLPKHIGIKEIRWMEENKKLARS
ncbi:type 1 fimbrial protein [Xenorhabdus sp. XENO-7]|uniref:Type 1 fimbrial protein n=1 Tax=Xenorhabdus aichiensis TaxID=3025874 RepID=A0ABT5M2J4_9GAMM|nr:type 1 fimbrial protein [Xenorhabdus aichiensis]MDC9621894.1 type 1 fimbrial protein [Xenorhabdus aichiensis]